MYEGCDQTADVYKRFESDAEVELDKTSKLDRLHEDNDGDAEVVEYSGKKSKDTSEERGCPGTCRAANTKQDISFDS